MNGCKQNSANITPTLAAGSVASPYYIQVNISQRLCSPACEDQSPVFNPTFSLVGYSEVGASQYVATIKVEGLISYVPKEDMPKYFYLMAVEKLKDKDRPRFVRDYFGV